jgi:hypothetical protein
MNQPIEFKTTISSIAKSRDHSGVVPRCGIIALLLVCSGLLPKAQAVNPPPDGGYPGGNMAEGQNALLTLTSGTFNTAAGFLSLKSNTTGKFNTAIGAGTLLANTADQNTATGAGALLTDTTGGFNTANGAFALFNNTIASENTAIGASALQNNTTGGAPAGSGTTEVGPNTAVGAEALFANATGGANTAVGFQALGAISTNSQSTAMGFKALGNSTSGSNDAFGYKALGNNTTGFLNTAIGDIALFNNTTGLFNVALGAATGASATTGSNNIYIGFGMSGVVGESNACYIGSIFGEPAPSGIPVLINFNNKLGTTTSSKRFKEDIKPMDKASEAILALKPVTFHYKSDAKNTPCFGLIAEDVAAVNPDLIVRDKKGEVLSVRYDQVNAMLLNEFLKEHCHVQKQDAMIAQQQKQIAALTAGLEKVSAQLATGRIRRGGPAPQVVNNP